MLLALFSLEAATNGYNHNLIPEPQFAEFGKADVTLKSVSLDLPAWTEAYINSLAELGVATDSKAKFAVKAEMVPLIEGNLTDSDEAYTLRISKAGINITAISEKGIYWALQTLLQLAEKDRKGVKLPVCNIVDWPAFRLRGFLMDVGRTYISMEELKREIAYMSRFKLNVFHWHLTENQAWRLESRIFPMINDSTNTERQPGKFYTIEDAKELQAFAKAHNMLLIPELDMPGHSAAFKRTFRHDMQSPEGMKILKLLVEEACETFDDVPYLHIGTDEVGFSNPDFVPEMVKFVRQNGKKAISWNPGWNYKPGEIDMIQMWSYRGKPTPGIPAIDSRFHYINHFDTYADLVALYRSQVYGQQYGTPDIAGVEIAIWNDRYVADEELLIAQNNLYPSLLATAELAWDGNRSEYFDGLGTNMAPEGSEDFKRFADFERRLLHHKATTLADVKIPYVKQTNVKWLITDAFPNNGNLAAVFPPETEGIRESYVFNDSTYNTTPATGAGIYLRHVWGKTVPSFYADPKPNHTAYALTWVYAPSDMTVGLQAETQNYSRSEPDIAPKQGEWDFRQSKIWVNDAPIAPPVWESVHSVRDNEITLTNENMATRPPIPVNLKKGWNKVMLKLPIGEFSTPETRLAKWMFTFVFTTPDGLQAAPGLIYSPTKSLK